MLNFFSYGTGRANRNSMCARVMKIECKVNRCAEDDREGYFLCSEPSIGAALRPAWKVQLHCCSHWGVWERGEAEMLKTKKERQIVVVTPWPFRNTHLSPKGVGYPPPSSSFSLKPVNPFET